MILVLSIVMIIIVLLILNYNCTPEYFDNLFTVDSPIMIPSNIVDNMPRHVVFNKNDGIAYISMQQPINEKNIKCPDFVDNYLTLGDNNFCWKK
ncbi:hypothetical protein Indivirus_1_231 [Indivirus ILV1]|uniref:Uncharacterized protein n=1 Tax=Indivirus ILV1 TaxID=1977633 RepID=A0A1V0SD76_9VIRU|nr:hypothetical protein Indivirus_1_231 [Indivirus ILV1]